jgi:hypothetical protein
MKSTRQSSVLDGFAPCHGDTARECMMRAAVCSRFAKLVAGAARERLYRLKNANIRAALRCSRGVIEVVVDRDRCYGLLSVRLRGADNVRVHTHENWINEFDQAKHFGKGI